MQIVILIKCSPKIEAVFGTVKQNLEEGIAADLSKFSAAQAKCFKRIFENYAALHETWKECFQKVGLSTDVKACKIGCQIPINTFNFFLGILLGERRFSQ